jgi:hypothetical protein
VKTPTPVSPEVASINAASSIEDSFSGRSGKLAQIHFKDKGSDR